METDFQTAASVKLSVYFLDSSPFNVVKNIGYVKKNPPGFKYIYGSPYWFGFVTTYGPHVGLNKNVCGKYDVNIISTRADPARSCTR